MQVQMDSVRNPVTSVITCLTTGQLKKDIGCVVDRAS